MWNVKIFCWARQVFPCQITFVFPFGWLIFRWIKSVSPLWCWYVFSVCLHRKPKGGHAYPWERGGRFLRLPQSHRREWLCPYLPYTQDLQNNHPLNAFLLDYYYISCGRILFKVIWLFPSFCLPQKVIFPNQDDCLISFLPLAHMFERLIEVKGLKSELWQQEWDSYVFMTLSKIWGG